MRQARSSVALLTTRRFKYNSAAAKSATQQHQSSQQKDEIQVTIPTLANEEIFAPFPSVNLPIWDSKSAATENIGRSFYLDNEFVKHYSTYRLPSALKREFDISKKPTLMFRSCTAQLLSDIEENSQKSADQRNVLFLDGEAGVGKSALMCQTAAYFSDKQWLVFPMVSVARWLYGEYPFKYNPATGKYDQPEAAVDLLKYFKQINAKSLTPQLSDIIEKGISSNAASSVDSIDGFKRLLDALTGAAESSTNAPRVLLAIDGVNGMQLGATNYRTKESEPIPSMDFTLIQELWRFFSGERKMENGVVLGAFSNWILGPIDDSEECFNSISCSGNSRPLKTVVPSFSQLETREMLTHYARFGFLSRSELTDGFVQKAYFLTGGNGAELFEFCKQRHVL